MHLHFSFCILCLIMHALSHLILIFLFQTSSVWHRPLVLLLCVLPRYYKSSLFSLFSVFVSFALSHRLLSVLSFSGCYPHPLSSWDTPSFFIMSPWAVITFMFKQRSGKCQVTLCCCLSFVLFTKLLSLLFLHPISSLSPCDRSLAVVCTRAVFHSTPFLSPPLHSIMWIGYFWKIAASPTSVITVCHFYLP